MNNINGETNRRGDWLLTQLLTIDQKECKRFLILFYETVVRPHNYNKEEYVLTIDEQHRLCLDYRKMRLVVVHAGGSVMYRHGALTDGSLWIHQHIDGVLRKEKIRKLC